MSTDDFDGLQGVDMLDPVTGADPWLARMLRAERARAAAQPREREPKPEPQPALSVPQSVPQSVPPCVESVPTVPVREGVLRLLAAGPSPAAAIATQLRRRKAAVLGVLHELEAAGQVERVGAGRTSKWRNTR